MMFLNVHQVQLHYFNITFSHRDMNIIMLKKYELQFHKLAGIKNFQKQLPEVFHQKKYS